MPKDLVDRRDLCGGKLQPGVTTLEIWQGEELLIIKDVPADVCQQCHKAYLAPEISIKLGSLGFRVVKVRNLPRIPRIDTKSRKLVKIRTIRGKN